MQSPHSMRRILLPAKTGFIVMTLFAALLLNMIPFGYSRGIPDWIALVLVFWCLHQPLKVGMSAGFILGLLMDVVDGSLMGQHALAYTALSYFAITIHRRLLWFPVPSQALQIMPLFLAAHAIELAIRMIAGGLFPGWSVLLAPVLESLLWPVASVLLLIPQRRAPNPDENRPL